MSSLREKPRVLQYARAERNSQISRIPGKTITYTICPAVCSACVAAGVQTCCRVSCCQLNTTQSERNESLPSPPDTSLLDSDIQPAEGDLTDRFYQQASFWVLFMVLLLIMVIVARSIYYSIKPNRVLELLRRMSTGPLSETREGKEGNIEPVLFYYEEVNQRKKFENKDSFKYKTLKAKKWFSHKIKENVVYELEDERKTVGNSGEEAEQIIDARKLLTRQLQRLERSCYEANNLNQPSEGSHRREAQLELFVDGCEGDCQSQSRTEQTSRRPSGTYSLSIDIPGPLAPSYQPNMVVSNVWNTNINMQRLYRYTTMQGIIYPPGYVP